MKSLTKPLAIISVALASMLCAASADIGNVNVSVTRKPEIPSSKNYNHLSFGPEVFWQHFSENKQAASAESNGTFGGARLRYECLQPDAFYAGTDGMFAAGRVKDAVNISASGENLAEIRSENRTAYVANIEQRLGYTIGMDGKRSSFTPFVGAGWYYTKPFANHDFSHDFVYATAGFKSNCEVNENFALGLVGKALYSFYDRTHVNNVANSTWDKTAWGVEVDLPMTWHLDDTKTWDLTFEPYFQDLDVSNHFMNVGGRLLGSYQF